MNRETSKQQNKKQTRDSPNSKTIGTTHSVESSITPSPTNHVHINLSLNHYKRRKSLIQLPCTERMGQGSNMDTSSISSITQPAHLQGQETSESWSILLLWKQKKYVNINKHTPKERTILIQCQLCLIAL